MNHPHRDRPGYSRREFLHRIVAGLAGAALLPSLGGGEATAPAQAESGLAIFDIPFAGQRYVDRVPDTLDLAARAALSINALTRATNASEGYSVYFSGRLNRRPPILADPWHWSKYWETLALLRIASGSALNPLVDLSWRSLLVQPDSWEWRALATMAVYQLTTGSPEWKRLAHRHVAEWQGRLEDQGDWAYIRHSTDSYWEQTEGRMSTGWGATWDGWVLQTLANYYRVTGYEPARVIAAKLARYLKDHAKVFDSQAHFIAAHRSSAGPAIHFHHHTNSLLGLAEYALATGDREYAQFAQAGYLYARAAGSPLVGFYPEYLVWPDNRAIRDCEACCVADMLALGLKLTETGVGDYWEDVDRTARNMFAEMQLRSGDWIAQAVAELPETPVGPGETAEDVPSRLVGAFAGWSLANDFYAGPRGGEGSIMNCCLGNAGRAIYYVWESILTHDKGRLRVNLLLNRASEWADVDSYLPYMGRVDIKLKKDCKLEVRLPEWIDAAQARAEVAGQPRLFSLHGRYAQLGEVKRGKVVSLRFALPERTVTEIIGESPYKLVLRGNDVVSIDPTGRWYPYYQRADCRRGHAPPLREVTRFVPSQTLHW